MIYLDNSATTYPKPQSVRQAVANALKSSANPGRSGHTLSMQSSERIFAVRQKAADFFGVPNPENIIFTLNCTEALNMVIKGTLKPNDHVVVSDLEHNSVMRPIESLRSMGVTYTAAKVFPNDNDRTVDSFRRAINMKTKMVICTHASNVWGVKLPIRRIAALAHEYGLLIAVDCAQSAGVVPINMTDDQLDFLCIAGHKGLYGPMGTGMLAVSERYSPDTLIEGGTGSGSESFAQPTELPDKFESGTPNLSGIVGLGAGMDYVSAIGIEKIAKHEFALITYLYNQLSQMPKVKLYMPMPTPDCFVPILSFNIEGMDSEEVAQILNRQGIAVRAGLHCCPAAHRSCDTLDIGAVRVSPSYFTSMNELSYFVSVIKKL